MKPWVILALAMSVPVAGQGTQLRISEINANNVDLSKDSDGFRVAMPRHAWQDPAKESPTDRNYMAIVPVDFHNGEIEAEIRGDLSPDAPGFARGFVGFAFRIAEGRFESIYLRPANGTSLDQVRRNHSVQYVSYPDYQFNRLRRESPEQYETAADIALGRWVHVRIVVKEQMAMLYLDRSPRPTLIVNDLKLGQDQRGPVGLWVETGTIAHFRKLRITSK